MSELKRLHPILDLFQSFGDKSETIAISADNEGSLTMKESAKLKSIKKMPTFESFKKAIVVLRHVRLEGKLKSEDDKICFWLNVRNALL
jgi:hypothetical protein